MSVKTEICGFSGHNFFPGHGRIHVREDKHSMGFETRKAFRMWERKRNPRKITWTEHYRHDHKKSVADTQEKVSRVNRKKVVRSYAGAAADGMKMNAAIVKKRVANQKKAPKKK